ncbi:MAG: hypothetical protein ACOCWD_02880, partial [Tangfeifania sp.]
MVIEIPDEKPNSYQAVLKIDAKIKNYSADIIKDYDLQVELFDFEKKKVFNKPVTVDLDTLAAEQGKVLNITKAVENPEKWSAENP